MNVLEDLLGKIITKFEISGEEYIKITTDNGEFTYIVEGDCCSSSYFSEIWNAKAIQGKTIIAVEKMELEEGDYRLKPPIEEDKYYGYKIRTEDTSCTIIFRNCSNGYYGGYMNKISEITDEEIKFKEISTDRYDTDDFKN